MTISAYLPEILLLSQQVSLTGEFLFLEATDELWIGLNDLSMQMYFEWSDGIPVTYTKWLPGEPTHAINGQEDCVVMAGEVKLSHLSAALYCFIFVSSMSARN